MIIYRTPTNYDARVASGSQQKELNGQDVINVTFHDSSKVDLSIGDYIMFQSKKYTLNVMPEVRKRGAMFEYDCVFEGIMYELSKRLYMDGIGADFFLTGNMQTFVDLLVTNMNRNDSGWVLESVLQTETRNLQFSNENCLQVLQKLCQEYECDFRIGEDKKIYVGEFGDNLTGTFSYGYKKGLYSLTRRTVDSKNIITRLYPFGSERNLPVNYRDYSRRLKLATGFIEKNTASYGVLESAKNFDDVYPRFTGSVTAEYPPYSFQVSTLDFNINDQLIPGTVARVHFKTGDLAGYEFEIATYNHSTKTITVVPSTDEKIYQSTGLELYTLPNEAIRPKVGDQIVLLDITMPQSYIDTAEAELLSKAQDYLDENSDPRVTYNLDIDPMYMKGLVIAFEVGDYVHVVDSDLSIDRLIRITGFTRDVRQPDKWDLEVSDHVAPAIFSRLIADVERVRQIVRGNKLDRVSRMRHNWRNTEELRNMIFDSEGYLEPGTIRPESIETAMLSVGSRSSAFVISGVFHPNHEGLHSRFAYSSGVLTHFGILDNGEPRTWSITQFSITGLNYGIAYYIYARCSKTTGSGFIELSVDKRHVDEGGTYYEFLVGILHSGGTYGDHAARGISMVYGHSSINGRYISTGRVQDVTGENYFDVDYGKFRIGNQDGSLDFNDTIAGKLVLKGGLVQRPSGEEVDMVAWRGNYDNTKLYYRGDIVLWDGKSWQYINSTAASNITPGTDELYWRLADGETGHGLTNRGDWVAATYYPGDYVFHDGSEVGTTSMWILKGDSEYVSSLQPKNDTANWSEFAALPGMDAKTLRLVSTGQVFRYGEDGNPDPAGQEITFNALEQNLAGSLVWSTTPSVTLTGSGNTRVLSITDFGANKSVRVNISKDGIEDYITVHRVVDGEDSILSYLTNEAHNVYASPDGSNWVLTGAVSFLRIKKGAELVTDGWTFSNTARTDTDGLAGKITMNCTAQITTSGAERGKITITGLGSGDVATVTIIATKAGYPNEHRVFTVTKSRQGQTGEQGPQGATGSQGAIGPGPVYRGDYSGSATYYGNSLRVDIVKYLGNHYVARTTAGTFSGVLPSHTGYWTPFGAEFTSIATGLLFAQMAYIDNLGVRHLRTTPTGKRIHIDGDDSTYNVYDVDGIKRVMISGDLLPTYMTQALQGTIIGRDGISTFYTTSEHFVVRRHATAGLEVLVRANINIAAKDGAARLQIMNGNYMQIRANDLRIVNLPTAHPAALNRVYLADSGSNYYHLRVSK